MPRIRTVKPELFQDEKIAPLEPIDRLVFIGLISMADDAGRLLDNVKVIDAFIFPASDDSSGKSLRILHELSRIVRYTSESGQRLIQIRNWTEHQKVEKPNRHVLPAPTAQDIAAHVVSVDSPNGRGNVGETSGNGSPIPPRYDLGPTTYDLRPTTNDLLPRRRNKAASAQNGGESWLLPASRAWERVHGEGSFNYGQAGRFLSPLHRAGLSDDEIAIRLSNYLSCKQGEKFFNLKDFAEHHKLYSGPLLDEFGVPTDLGRRVAAGDVRSMSA